MPNIIHGGGGSSLKLNVFAQPDLPTDKFDGVLLQTSAKETIKKVVFDTNVWAAGQWQIPTSYSDAASSIEGQSNAYNGKIYSIGPTSFAYDPLIGTSSILALYPNASYAQHISQIIVGDKIYCFGGCNSSGHIQKSCYAYDIINNTYTSLADCPSSYVTGMRLVYANGYIYCIGGGYQDIDYTDHYYTTRNMYRYDIVNDTYTQLASYPNNVESDGVQWAGCVFYNNKIYIFGGRHSYASVSDYLTLVYAYDITLNTFAQLTSLPVYSYHAALVGSKVLILGLSSSPNLSYLYDILNDTYSQTNNPESAFNTFGSTCLISNIVFATQGTHVYPFMLTAKQYPNSPSVIFYRLSGDTTFESSIIKGKLIDNLPTNFKDCMLFKDGEITFPALYIGDGTQWNLARAAQ